MHLRRPKFTYSVCRPFIKNKEGIQKLKEIGDSRYIYQNELNKACFQHDMAYGDFKDLTRTTASDKILDNKAFNIAKNSKCNEYQRGLASMVYTFFDKENSGSGIKNENMSDQKLAEELLRPVIYKIQEKESTVTFYRQYLWC